MEFFGSWPFWIFLSGIAKTTCAAHYPAWLNFQRCYIYCTYILHLHVSHLLILPENFILFVKLYIQRISIECFLTPNWWFTSTFFPQTFFIFPFFKFLILWALSCAASHALFLKKNTYDFLDSMIWQIDWKKQICQSL